MTRYPEKNSGSPPKCNQFLLRSRSTRPQIAFTCFE